MDSLDIISYQTKCGSKKLPYQSYQDDCVLRRKFLSNRRSLRSTEYLSESFASGLEQELNLFHSYGGSKWQFKFMGSGSHILVLGSLSPRYHPHLIYSKHCELELIIHKGFKDYLAFDPPKQSKETKRGVYLFSHFSFQPSADGVISLMTWSFQKTNLPSFAGPPPRKPTKHQSKLNFKKNCNILTSLKSGRYKKQEIVMCERNWTVLSSWKRSPQTIFLKRAEDI